MYALVDCNNFYASCERVFKPQLRNKPIVILSNNDGCVIARSDQAKVLGVPMGAPAFKYKNFFKKHGITVFSSNYALYGDMSNRVMSILSDFTPNIEVYSIDEAFLSFKGFENYDLNSYGIKMQKRILKWTGIPTSVGIAPTKALSKVANKIARKYPKQTTNVHIIDTEEKRIKALKWTKIESVWGIGKQLSKRLKNQGIKTAYDFTLLNDSWVRGNFSVTELNLKKDLEGFPTLTLDNYNVSKKSISTTRTFETTIENLTEIVERVSTFSSNCAKKLRQQNSLCTTVIVSLSNNRFKKNTEYYNNHLVISLPFPSNSDLVIVKYAVQAIKTIYKKNITYKRAGVIVTGLVPADNHQLNIFESQNPKHTALMHTIDTLNTKLESTKIKLANQDLKHTWKMRQEYLSSRYTTDINELIIVK